MPRVTPFTGSIPADRNGISDSGRYPWAIGPPLSLVARSTSTWIHWWSPVASANRTTISWVTCTQSVGASSRPTRLLAPSTPSRVIGLLTGSPPVGAGGGSGRLGGDPLRPAQVGLAGRAAVQLREDEEFGGPLVVGEPLADVRPRFLRRELGAGVERDDG